MSIKAATSPTCDIEGFIRAINQPNVKAVIYFFSGEYERLEPHKAIKRAFPQAACIGASMIGGWSTAGASEKGIVGISLSSDEVAEAFISLQEGVKRNPVLTVEKVIRDLKQKLGHRTLYPDAYLGIVVFDGLCRGEDVIKRFTLEDDFNLDLVGGAAADELQFKKTLVSADDKCSDDGVAVVVLNMKIPFYCNHYVHYIPTDTSFTVTKAEPFKRIVWEINDQNAADYYAKIIHVSGPEKFSPSLFAKNPVGIVMGDTVYARALDIVIPGPGL
ncbi:MAG: hypothetical protein LBP76_05210, partial [Treponema sp.]|nr:hypothetical protein [Treponema sp.]